MQINRDYESETNLRGLLFYILYRWRSIIIIAILCAIAFGGKQYLSSVAIRDAEKLTKEEQQYQLDLQNYQENLVGNKAKIDKLTKRLEAQKEYMTKSIYFQLDAQNVWTAESKYLIKVNQSTQDSIQEGSTIDPADSILPCYTVLLDENIDEKTLKKAFNTDETEYIREIISVLSNVSDNTITVLISGSTKENVERGMELISRQIQQLAVGKAQEIAAHQLITLGRMVYLRVDQELEKKQVDLLSQMTNDQKQLQQARTNLNELLANGEPRRPGKHIVRIAVIGFIIGAFFMIGLYFICFTLNMNLKESSIMIKHYNLPVIGEIHKNGSLHRNRSFDKVISLWELGHEVADSETTYNQIASLIEMQEKYNSLFLISTLSDEKILPVQKELTARFLDKRVEVGGHFLLKSDVINKAAKADAVIIVEEKYVSRQKDIHSVVETLLICKANVIGTIIL